MNPPRSGGLGFCDSPCHVKAIECRLTHPTVSLRSLTLGFAQQLWRFSHLLDVEVVAEESDESAESAMALESKLADPDAVLCCASMEVLISQAGPDGASSNRVSESAGRLL